jgi:hypothetical protein
LFNSLILALEVNGCLATALRLANTTSDFHYNTKFMLFQQLLIPKDLEEEFSTQPAAMDFFLFISKSTRKAML